MKQHSLRAEPSQSDLAEYYGPLLAGEEVPEYPFDCFCQLPFLTQRVFGCLYFTSYKIIFKPFEAHASYKELKVRQRPKSDRLAVDSKKCTCAVWRRPFLDLPKRKTLAYTHVEPLFANNRTISHCES